MKKTSIGNFLKRRTSSSDRDSSSETDSVFVSASLNGNDSVSEIDNDLES